MLRHILPFVLGLLAAPAATAETCAAAGGFGFVCGLESVEDLVPLPGGMLLVGSSMKPGSAGLYLIDAIARVRRPLRLAIAGARDSRTPDCPPPDLGRLATRGLDVVPGAGGTATIYAVNHGGRESVEVFRFDPATTTASWTGCVILPPGESGNAVAALRGGGLAISRFFAGSDPQGMQHVLAGASTGIVHIWTPGKGFATLPGSALAGDNGLAASPDGRWLFVAAYGQDTVWRLPLDGHGAPTSTKAPFHPDNLRWAPDGTLVATGQFLPDGQFAGLHDWGNARLDPRTMKVVSLARETGLPQFDAATTTAEAGGTQWFGSYHGDRIAYRLAPADR